MKRLISILFIVVYATTAFATTYDFHFCHGKMVGSALLNISNQPKCCCGDSDNPMKGCCKDEIITCKADNHRTTPSIAISIPISPDFALPIFLSFHLAPKSQVKSSRLYQCISTQSSEPVYLLTRVIRI